MLYFTQRPDAVLAELLDIGLTLVGDALRDGEDALDCFPEDVVRMFGGPAAIRSVLIALQAASADPRDVFEINDYHMILLYYALESACEIYNDTMRDEAGEACGQPAIVTDGEVVSHVDFGTLCDFFFPDTDFLGAIDLLDPRIPQESLDAMGLRDTTMPVTARMRPHPAELPLIRLEGTPDWQEENSGVPWWRTPDH